MGKKSCTFFLGIIFLIACTSVFGSDSDGMDAEIRINIGLKSQQMLPTVADLMDQYKGRKAVELPAINALTYEVRKDQFNGIRLKLLSHAGILFVEKDVLASIPETVIADDPLYPEQWGPFCIGAEGAWKYDELFNHPEIVVAVVDTGVDLDHPDLVENVDTSLDYDFVNNDDVAMDDNGHGTHCAGIIAAGINNGVGISGLQNVTIMAVKALNEKGAGWSSDLANAVIYAADNGANVISNSWGSLVPTRVLSQAVQYAVDRGSTVVAAAGNNGSIRNNYPAAYPGVIGVAALENCSQRASYSNYGTENVFISAPGSSILSTIWDDMYASASGTSMACPHVAAAAAMWIGTFASKGTVLTPYQVMYLLAMTADDLGEPGRDAYYGWGVVNMFPWK